MPTSATSSAPPRRSRGRLRGPAVVVTKSTVPVGTGDEVERIIRETAPEAQAWVVSNPEFLREGAAIEDFKRPDRIVVGTEDEAAAEVMREIYRPLYLNKAPLLFTGRRTAELIKYAANAFLATKITFINEMADLCEAVGADVQDVARGIGLDNRIGAKFLHAGPGYGGSCFPKDTLALAEDRRGPSGAAADRRSGGQGERGAQAGDGPQGRRRRSAARRAGRTVALLGLTFKPNTDDMRDAPSLSIVQALQDAGASVRGFDPEGIEQARPMMPGVDFFDNPYAAAAGADAVVLVTEWDVLRALDLKRLARDDGAADLRRPAQRLSAGGGRAGRPALVRRRPAAAATEPQPEHLRFVQPSEGDVG